MRYSFEPKYRKYVEEYGFLSFARKFGEKCGKKLWILQQKPEKMLQKMLLKEQFKKRQK